jgi:hypothetical protein
MLTSVITGSNVNLFQTPAGFLKKFRPKSCSFCGCDYLHIACISLRYPLKQCRMRFVLIILMGISWTMTYFIRRLSPHPWNFLQNKLWRIVQNIKQIFKSETLCSTIQTFLTLIINIEIHPVFLTFLLMKRSKVQQIHSLKFEIPL